MQKSKLDLILEDIDKARSLRQTDEAHFASIALGVFDRRDIFIP